MKKLLALLIGALLVLSSTTPGLAAAPKPGAACPTLGKSQTVAGKKYTCVKVKGKKVWSKPVAVKAPIPVPTLEPSVLTSGDAATSQSCELYSTDETSFHFVDNGYKGVYPSTGSHKVFFAFVKFADYTPGESPDIWMQANGVDFPKFFKTNSYGRLAVTEGHNKDWVTLPGAASNYSWFSSTARSYYDHLNVIRAGLQAVDSDVDFTKYDSVAVMFGIDPRKYTGGTAAWNSAAGNVLVLDGKRFASASNYTTRVMLDWTYNAPRVLTHELGHTFGLQDLYAYQGLGDYPSIHRFVGQIDVMGFINALSPSILVWNRWRLNWLDDKDMFCVEKSSTSDYLVNSVNSLSGSRLLVVKSSGSDRIAVEYRPIGLDGFKYGGLVVYRVNRNGNGLGSITVDRTSSNPLNLVGEDFIGVGQSKCLPEICISFKKTFGDGAVVGLSTK